MNLIFLEEQKDQDCLHLSDPRAVHILNILKMAESDTFYVGIPNGPRGLATITELSPTTLNFNITWESTPFEPLPIDLILGTPRPQTARKILQEATSLGVRSFHFYVPEKGEASYASSKLWTTPEWKKHLLKGAEQSFTTFIPAVHHYESLKDCLSAINLKAHHCLALDNYEATQSTSQALKSQNPPFALVIGAERGLSGAERKLLIDSGFGLAYLGSRVLRSETATLAALTLIASALGEF